VNGGHLAFCANFGQSDPQLWKFLLVPQAWTLGVELSFYALAPFIVRRWRPLIALFCCAWFARAAGAAFGLVYDPWNYRFFPFELGIFLLGALSCKLFLRYAKAICLRPKAQWMAYIGTIIILVTASHPRLHGSIVTAALLFWTFLALPFLFHFQQNHRFDGILGELSYPLYIGHYLVTEFMGRNRSWGEQQFGALISSDAFFSLLAIAASLVVALLLKVAIADPMEKFRKTVKSQDRRPIAPTPAVRRRPQTVVSGL